jgi:3-hydroxyisobutyrate dehydrogenase-like beta-hydroxyacid dehydrogenase
MCRGCQKRALQAEEMNVREPLGFGGVGKMGSGMAACLLKAGFELTVCDNDPNATARLAAAGATVAASPQAVADRATIVFACLPAPPVSEEVAAQIARGSAVKIYVETSTVGTDTMKIVGRALEPAGIALLDAPISGGPQAAATGTLSTIVSGAEVDFARVRPAIDAFAKHIFFLGGDPGQAQVAKLINNMMSMAGRAVAIEGVIMGMQVGIDPDTLAKFINVSTGRNLATIDDFPTRLLHVFETGGKKSIGLKDLELYLKEAERLDVPVWATPRVRDLFLEGQDYGVKPAEELPLSRWVEGLKRLQNNK